MTTFSAVGYSRLELANYANELVTLAYSEPARALYPGSSGGVGA